MASWTTMTNLTAGDLVTEADMDAIRGNIEYLLTPNTDQAIYDNTAVYTTTSASFVAVDATNVKATITTYGGPVLVTANGYTYNSGANANYFDIDVDGTRVGTGFAFGIGAIAGTSGNKLCIAILVTGLAAGAHTFTLFWWTGGGTATIDSRAVGAAVTIDAIEL